MFLTLLSLLSFTILSMNSDKKKMATYPKVVIVGGGISGLSSASRLFRSGFENVTILEASNRGMLLCPAACMLWFLLDLKFA